MAKKRRAGKVGGARKTAKKTAKKNGAFKRAKAKSGTKKAAKKVAGYTRRKGSGILIPNSLAEADGIVPPSLMEKGIAEAKKRMKDMLHEMSDFDGATVRSADFQVSLSAKGEFLGFGAGGATSITLHVDIDDE